MQTLVERVFRHERAVLITILTVVTAACWWWIVPMARDMYGSMTGPSAWMMRSHWDAPHVLLLAAMWIVMMAGMMLPSAAPVLLLYATSPSVSGGLLVLAGVYQLTPLKRTCLASCSSPVDFRMRRWRDGTGGAFRLGIEHGLFCAGCCWALMLLLLAGGVMNLTVIAALTAFVLIEKLTPFGLRTVRVTGAFLIAFGLWVMTR